MIFRRSTSPSLTSSRARDALWVIVWVASSLAFGVWIFVSHGAVAAAEYYAAYFLEKSLSVDNIFVFIIIFSELRIPAEHQRRVLWYGAGVALIARLDWVIYPFGALILLAAWRMLFGAERERKVVKEACNVCETWIARVVPVSPVLRGHEFWRRENGRRVATPLLVALVVIETTDIVFALDSVPAVLAITRNPLIVYSSNIMAMLGLRSLYFVLSDVITRLRYLRMGLAALLAFTGTKMLAGDRVHIGPGTSVLVIGLVLLVTIAASVVAGPPATHDSRTASI